MIHLRDVHLTLESAAGPVRILRGVTLEVATGETVGILGRSGAGKSSLLAVVAGIERATSGEVEVGGLRLDRMSEDELALFRRARLGILFQAFHLVPTMTAAENVALPLELARRPDPLRRARELLGEVGLAARADHYPSQLSGGEQQRVALARAIANDPELLLADEPTGNLDAETGEKVMDLVFDLQARRGTTLLLVTHEETVARRCGRLVRLHGGRVVA